MPALMDLLLTTAFAGVWLMIASELVSRHAREAKRVASGRSTDF